MAISSTVRKAGPYSGDGTATQFSFDFKVFTETDIAVIRADALGVESTLVIDSDYSVTLNADQNETPGGLVTFTAAPAAGQKVVLLSAVPDLQPVDATNQGGFYPETLNDGLDRSTIQTQQVRELLGRQLTLPITAPADVSLALPLPVPNQLLAWGEDGKELVAYDPSGLAGVIAYGATRVDTFNGDGTTLSFTLSANPGLRNNLRISIDGVVQVPGDDFTWSAGTTLSFVQAPPAGTKIMAQYQEALVDIGGAEEAGATAGANSGAAAAAAVLDGKADRALGNVGGADFGNKAFPVSGRPTPSGLGRRFARLIDMNNDYGMAGNNIANDGEALAELISDANAAGNPVYVVGEGIFKLDFALPDIQVPMVFDGGNKRKLVLVPYDASGGFRFIGNTTVGRIADAGFRNAIINALPMSSGFAVQWDFCQNTLLHEAIVTNAYNAISVRQCGDINLTRSRIDKARGDFGLYVQGPNAMRNGELDKIDVLDITDCTFEGVYTPGDAVKNTDLFYLDGRVHTINAKSFRLLSAKSGMKCLNSFGLAQQFAPSFIHGRIETENTWEEGVRIEWGNDIDLDLFCATSVSEHNAYFGANAKAGARIRLTSQNAWKDGLYIAPGAGPVTVDTPNISVCNQSNGGFGGINDAAGTATIVGGLIGSAGMAYSVKGLSTTYVLKTDLTGSVVSISGPVTAANVKPSHFIAPVSLSVGAAPWVYTAGETREVVTWRGGAIIGVSIGGTPVFASDAFGSLTLNPGQSLTIDFSATPYMTSTKIM